MKPRFTISTSGFAFSNMTGFAEMVARLGADGLDIDATSRFGRGLAGISSQPKTSLPVPIASIWLNPADLSRSTRQQPSTKLADEPSPLARQGGVQLVIRLRASPSKADQETVIAARRAFKDSPWAAGVTLAVPAVAPDGGRAHLTRLQALRRLVEEWEMQIALDLPARADLRWEAEAAIQVLGPRLSIVRLQSPLSQSPGRLSDTRIRTIRVCAEQGYAGTVALVPFTPLLLRWHLGILERDLAANRDDLFRLFANYRLSVPQPPKRPVG